MRRKFAGPSLIGLVAALLATLWLPATSAQALAVAPACARTITADVVALDQVFFFNRLGAVEPQGMIYALRRDIVPIDATLGLVPGNVQLRPDKRPRPLVLRMAVGDCLEIHFQNLLNPTPVDQEQPATRNASIHALGLQEVGSIASDGSNVGQNVSSLVPPGGTAVYTYYGEREGQHVFHSAGAMTGGEGDGGSVNSGLFGAINVEPAGALWYRSQVTHDDLMLATKKDALGNPIYTPAGQPVVDYDAVYPPGHPQAGTPILRMVDAKLDTVHSDLTAMILGGDPGVGGPGAGRFPAGTYIYESPELPDRHQPFREFTIMYHDEIGAVQAFPQFYDAVLSHTLHSGRDAFAINYGTGGIGAEILANRIGVGPQFNCTECKYEEFFLTSWALGDPAMVVDVPANAPCTPAQLRPPATGTAATGCTPKPGPKATKALYPDDPSNVYHSYIRDHVKFRILHGGSKEHHIHHLHAHQWVYSPDSDNSAYLDSQAIGPGSSFTLDIVYNGTGNRNQVVGDSIFHCHFYPHFAQGMWALWRSHDVFEAGTPLDAAGRPLKGSRAYPDGEIAAGTPIVALVPLPGKPMPPMPQAQVSIVGGQVQISGTGNPGYPFFVPGVAGHRPPHPPLDTLDDGGLQRHVITGGKTYHVETRLDFTKELLDVTAKPLAEKGEPVEQAAMAYHEIRNHPTCYPDGTCDASLGGASAVDFVTNGLPRQHGAPYAEPCIDDNGKPIGTPRLYKAADIQTDVVLNKAGWHFPQQRMLALWQDVVPTLNGTRPPEPLFFRANTDDCITYELTNLVPNIYELDDFQVRTPTDILGQHIHLVKFDVTSSDGAANGWNYEDGSFSPDEVREREHAIRVHNGCIGDEVSGGDSRDGTFTCPVAKVHPFFGPGPDNDGDGVPDWLGAVTTYQRWFADNTLNLAGKDRTLRTVFTHDHFGPSTHQQAGLYAGLVVEPKGSTWFQNETGVQLGTHVGPNLGDDGGPTSWQAVIQTANLADSYREFLFEFQDYQLAYKPNAKKPLLYDLTPRQPGEGYDDPPNAINPPARQEAALPTLLEKMLQCPGGVPLPCPEVISSADVGTMSVNYRDEPVALRVRNPTTNTQAAGQAGDLAYAFSSNVTRSDPAFNVQPTFYPPLTSDLHGGDPFTPLLRAYAGDNVQMRVLVGAHEEGHNFSINGMKWHFEPSETNSGYRGSQMMGISEHFEFLVPQLPKSSVTNNLDYLWAAGSSTDDLWNGLWGLMRVYQGQNANLKALPSNPPGSKSLTAAVAGTFNGVCPKSAPVRTFRVVATTAQKILPGGTLVYNSRAVNGGPLNDPTATIYVRKSDLDPLTGVLNAGVPIEPLVLRADAGDCIQVDLLNDIKTAPANLAGWSSLPMIVDGFNNNDIQPSQEVGLHPQLVFYDASRSDGNNVGLNLSQTAAPGQIVSYRWYAGDFFINNDGTAKVTPIEYGATNLIPADRIKQPSKGLVGSLIIEPQGATWVEDTKTRAAATVTKPDGTTFRELVVMFQNDVDLRYADGTPIKNVADDDDPEDSGAKALNFRTEPMWFRMGYKPETPFTTTRTFDFTDAFSNSLIGGDPETPVFTAHAGEAVRFRVLHAGGHSRNNVFTVHGHTWEHEPYINGSTQIGHNPKSLDQGARMGHGPTDHFDAVLENGAGGLFGITGDYLFRDYASFGVDGGLWGILRVVP